MAKYREDTFEESQIRDRIDKVKRRVSRVSETRVNTMDHDTGKEACVYVIDEGGKRMETTIGGNKIREQEISFQGIYRPGTTFSISGDPRDVRISVVVGHTRGVSPSTGCVSHTGMLYP